MNIDALTIHSQNKPFVLVSLPESYKLLTSFLTDGKLSLRHIGL